MARRAQRPRSATRQFLPSVMIAVSAASGAQAPQSQDLQQVLQRMVRLEQQNREVMAEIRALRQELAANKPAAEAPAVAAADTPAVEERATVQEQRTAQLDQEKVASDHLRPVTLTGMLLMDKYCTGKGAGTDNPTVAPF